MMKYILILSFLLTTCTKYEQVEVEQYEMRKDCGGNNYEQNLVYQVEADGNYYCHPYYFINDHDINYTTETMNTINSKLIYIIDSVQQYYTFVIDKNNITIRMYKTDSTLLASFDDVLHNQINWNEYLVNTYPEYLNTGTQNFIMRIVDKTNNLEIVSAWHPDKLTTTRTDFPEDLIITKCWYESGVDKYNKLTRVIKESSGTIDTSNVSVVISSTKGRWIGGTPVSAEEEIINFPAKYGHPKGEWAFKKGDTILFTKDNIMSHCTDLNYELGEGVFYIEFYKNGTHLNTSSYKYSTPIGNKLTLPINL